MITKELVDKINALWHKQNSVGLTDEEKEEQRMARQEYVDAIKSQMRNMLDSIKTSGDPDIGEKPAGKHHCSCDHCKH